MRSHPLHRPDSAACLAAGRATCAIDRRRLLGSLGIAAVGLAAGPRLLGDAALAAGVADALLLNCIDYRLADATTRYMAGRGLAGKYDQVVLAGAALGAKNDRFPAWGQTFWDHVQVARDLHHITRIIVLDHRDCGAYKVILGKDLAGNPAEELTVHTAQMHALRGDIAARHPELQVELLLMGLDGKVETVV